ncbi:hypothetical protein BDN72DRAFT_82456 [Pluteus cervinus]|uniref:Uncharacterized protein n=1 Tax=Pluteus cervinus TaxID=181527 RepID=A0ACD3AQE1_9AGAR|nr:hypothetical protein BDN72DRAFT_82456 [Pluteus cervinus]
MEPTSEVFLGALLLGTWINFILYSIEVAAIILYLSKQGRRRTYQYIVIGLLLNDSLCVAADCAYCWLMLIQKVPDPRTPLFRWRFPITIITTSLAAMVEQYLLIHRFRTLSKSVFVSFIIGLLVVFHVSFNFLAGISMAIDPNFDFGPNLATVSVTIATALCAFIDVLIPGALVLTLRKMKTSFHSTNGLIRRVSINVIASGLTVGLFGISVPLVFQLRSNGIPVVTGTFGRLYTLTVLVNLLLTNSSSSRTGENSGIHTDGDLENSVALSDSMLLTPVHRCPSISYHSGK